jgi:hypothetical protein
MIRERENAKCHRCGSEIPGYSVPEGTLMSWTICDKCDVELRKPTEVEQLRVENEQLRHDLSVALDTATRAVHESTERGQRIAELRDLLRWWDPCHSDEKTNVRIRELLAETI